MASLLALEPTTGGAFAEGAGAGSTGSWGEGLPRDKGWGRSRRRSGLRQNPVCWRGKPGATRPPGGVLPRVRSSSVQTPTRWCRSGEGQGCRGISTPVYLNSSGNFAPWDVGKGVSF